VALDPAPAPAGVDRASRRSGGSAPRRAGPGPSLCRWPASPGRQPRGLPGPARLRRGIYGYVEARRPADRQPAAPVCRASGSAQPQPHRAPGARHRAGPGRCRARPGLRAVGHRAPVVADRGAPGPVEGERGGVPAPLPLQRRTARRLPQVRAGRAAGGRGRVPEARRGLARLGTRSPGPCSGARPLLYLVGGSLEQLGHKAISVSPRT
jgi:hypothetical protein